MKTQQMTGARIVAFCLVAMMACSKTGEAGEDGQEGNEDAIEDPGSAADASSHAIPAALSAIEGAAEDGYDKGLAGDFAAAKAAAATVGDQWAAYRPQAIRDGAQAAWLTGMDGAVAGFRTAAAAGTDKVTVARAANAISAWMDKFFGLYSNPVPVEVIRLDYLGREVVLDAMSADFVAAARQDSEIEATWTQVRPKVVAAGGTQQAKDTDAALVELATAIQAKDGPATIAKANAVLDLVDSLEGVFAK